MTVLNLKSTPKRLPAEVRFNSFYSPEALTGCWLWLGRPRGSNGYGSIASGGKIIPAHRFSYEMHKGAIPDGKLVLHDCDTPMCVNPNHLFLGSHQDNADDKVRKGRQAKGEFIRTAQATNKASGERNGNSRLNAEHVMAIRASSDSQRALAKRYGVSQAAIWNIFNKRTWK